MCGSSTCCTAAAMSTAFTCLPDSLSTSCSRCSMLLRLRFRDCVTEVKTLPTVVDTVCAAMLAAVVAAAVEAFSNWPEEMLSLPALTGPATSALTLSITGASDDVSAAATIWAICALLGAAAPPAAAAPGAAAPACCCCCGAAAAALLPLSLLAAVMPVPRPVRTVFVSRPANWMMSAGLLKSGRATVVPRPAAVGTQQHRSAAAFTSLHYFLGPTCYIKILPSYTLLHSWSTYDANGWHVGESTAHSKLQRHPISSHCQ